MRKLFFTASVLPLLVFPGVAPADTSLGIRGGTFGAGIELSYALSQRAALRLNVDGFNSGTRSKSQADIQYDVKAKLQTASLLGDWFPFANNFRISAGAIYNGNKFTLKGQPTGGTYTINDVTFQASDIGSLDGTVDFKTAAPYFGIGYGRPINGGLSFISDLGVMFQGSPKSTLTATCGPSAPQGGPTCTSLQDSVAAQQASLDNSLSKFKYYPVFSVGLAYTF